MHGDLIQCKNRDEFYQFFLFDFLGQIMYNLHTHAQHPSHVVQFMLQSTSQIKVIYA